MVSLQEHIHYLKEIVLTVARISILSSADCMVLKELIEKKTGLSISIVVLARLFDITPSKFPPSTYSLNTLSIYCGYADWQDFMKNTESYIHNKRNTL